MVPATHSPPPPVNEPADSIISAGSAGRILAGAPAPSTAPAPAGGSTWTEEV